MPPTPVIPVPPLRWVGPASLADTPPPTIRLNVSPPPPPPFVIGSSGADGSSFGGGADGEPAETMPNVGDVIQGFELAEELGRGTFGRVFLARQVVLGGRRVALKVTLRATREPERLARLQHTNVVPVYSVHAAGSAQLICMPFLGRQTLADALKSYRSSARSGSGWSGKVTRARRGSTTVTTGVPRPANPAAPPAQPATPGPVADLIGEPALVLRLLSQLAAGLAHAHGRGILHLDIKPGNILLADTGEPMLLDFNLSVDAAEPDRELVGGTVPYMAPEQLLDMHSRGRGVLDARTDLYSLGVVVYELLTGMPPFPAPSRTTAELDRLLTARRAGPPPLRADNPAVTPAVDAIVRKLLAPDPAGRYQTAAELKDDVDRQLSDRPLKYARDRSVAERAGKWRRRHPRLLAGCVFALVLLTAGGTTALAVQAADERTTAEARIKARDAADRIGTLRLDLGVPDEPLYQARGVARGGELLASYGLPDDPNWQARPAVQRLPDDARAALTADLGELAVLLAANRAAAARDVSGDQTAVYRAEAARFARAATDCYGGAFVPPALAAINVELGLVNGLPRPATSGRDHFLDAVEAVRAKRFDTAVGSLEEATLSDPSHGAAQYLLAHVLEQRGERDRAVERYALAAALMPTNPRPYRQWGRAELTAGRYERADRVYGLAVTRAGDPHLTAEFRYYRGTARYNLGRYAEAADDFSTARGVHPVAVRLKLAAAREKTGDLAGAADDRQTADAAATVTMIDRIERGRDREAKNPAGARSDYQDALAAGRAPPEAFRGLLRLAFDRANDPADGLRVSDAAVAGYPALAEFHAARALALARLGRTADARAAVGEAERLNPSAETAFRIASALARSSDAADHPAALGWLRKAYLGGVRDAARYDAATDLQTLRLSKDYGAFRAAIGEVNR